MGVPHQHQPAPTGQGREQRLHEHQVHHGGLVQDHGVGVQRLLLVVGEGQAAGGAVIAGLQQPVDGGGLRPAGFRQPLRRPPGGGGQGRPQAQVVKQR